MSKPSAADVERAKTAKQKKLLLLLAPVLLVLVAWQGPKSYQALTGSEAAPPPPPVTSTAVDPSAAPAPGAAAPVPGGTGPLPDTDPAPEALEGQLIRFSRFLSKDPFRGLPSTAAEDTPDPEEEGPANTAVLAVNGDVETVTIGGGFPAGEPVFRLVSITDGAAQIGLVDGGFSNGAETIEVKVGETLVLVANPDGTRYAIKLVSVAYVPPA